MSHPLRTTIGSRKYSARIKGFEAICRYYPLAIDRMIDMIDMLDIRMQRITHDTLANSRHTAIMALWKICGPPPCRTSDQINSPEIENAFCPMCHKALHRL